MASPPVIASAVDLVMAVQDFAICHAGSLAELDINPVLVQPQGQGVVAVDALLRNAI